MLSTRNSLTISSTFVLSDVATISLGVDPLRYRWPVIAYVFVTFAGVAGIQVNRGLRRAQKQIAIGSQDLPHILQDLLLGFHREINHHISEQDQVDGRHERPGDR